MQEVDSYLHSQDSQILKMSNDEQEMKDWSIGWYWYPGQTKAGNGSLCHPLHPRRSGGLSSPYPTGQKAKSGPLKPLFPGYFFARFDPVEHLRNVHYARGVAYIVRCKGVPVHVSPQVMIELRLLSPMVSSRFLISLTKLEIVSRSSPDYSRGMKEWLPNSSQHGIECVYFLKFLVVQPKWKSTNTK